MWFPIGGSLEPCVYLAPLRRYDKECLWIQEATGEVWISLEHNIVDTAVNEWRNCLHVCDCTIGQHFDQFYCRQLRNERTG